MKFDYLKQPNFLNPQKPWISRPVIPVRLSYKDKYLDVYALIDSGADASIFHSSIAKELDIDIVSGRKEKFFGISGEGIDVYFHKVQIQIIGSSESIGIEAGFTDSKGVGAILGQAGFFENYHIKFERDKERVEITPLK
jgi:hypothetical protein